MHSLVYFSKKYLCGFIFFTILINGIGLFFPLLRNDDPVLYASIAKNIALTNNWIDLMHPLGSDWLDKPHLPFWITAISFKLLGINSFAYMLPGFIFNLMGGYYTYRLGKVFFNQSVGLLSALIYFSAFHLQLSATIDIRAEAYLMGMIVPACYYGYCYFIKDTIDIKNLILGAVFTALAVMTKGLFTLITIYGGLFIVWLVHLFNSQEAKSHALFSLFNLKQILKLILPIVLTLIFIFPELLTLYLQFDIHPEKIIFGKTHVSGVKWFFWDSQFGRFFNTGPISRQDVSFGHYFFFIHTFMWAFLPWSVMFVVATYKIIRVEITKPSVLFLLTTFGVTFILFSLTKFQLDYYTNIIMPFAAIICAKWLYLQRKNHAGVNNILLKFQIYFSILLMIIVLILSYLIFSQWLLGVSLTCGGVIALLFILFAHRDTLSKAIVYSVLSINLFFVFAMLIYGNIVVKYDAGYQISQYLNEHKVQNVVDYRINSLTLEFYVLAKYSKADNTNQLKFIKKPYYIVAYADDGYALLNTNNTFKIVTKYSGATIDKVLGKLLDINKLNQELTHYVVLEVR